MINQFRTNFKSYIVKKGTTIGCDKNEMKIYDSVYCTIDRVTKVIIHNLFSASKALKIKVLCPQKQVGTQDCGLFAIAYAISIAYGHGLTKKLDQQKMRHHLCTCFRNSAMTVFPSNNIHTQYYIRI